MIVEKFKQSDDSLMPQSDIRVETRDSQRRGLDASYCIDKNELQEFTRLLEGVGDLLIVSCAGGNAGGGQSRLLALFASSQDIPTTAVIGFSAEWEGGVRTVRSRALRLDLKSMGVKVETVDANGIFTDDTLSVESGFEEMDVQMSAHIRYWIQKPGANA